MSRVLIILGVLGVLGVFGLVIAGAMVIPKMDFGWFSTPEVSQKNLDNLANKGLQTATGYTPAKTPTEAMDLFREAIQKRKYKYAAVYCTKNYADMLVRANDKASELGGTIDQISDYAKEKGLLTDRLTYVFYQLDPFPKNFKVGPAPEQKGDSKAIGKYLWEPLPVKNPSIGLDPAFKTLDLNMFQKVLAPGLIFGNPIELVKEGDAWKLNIPTNQPWETAVSYYIDHARTYHTGLDSFRIYMTNERFASPNAFENDVMEKLRNANAK